MNPTRDAQFDDVEGMEAAIDSISIRARAALGALCIRRYASTLDVHHSAIEELVDYCFALGSAKDIVAWEQNPPRLARGMGEPLPPDVADAVGQEHKDSFGRLRDEVLGIGYCDLYGATTDWSKRHLLAALRILQADNVPIPDPTPFRVSSFNEWHGWGEVVPSEVAAHWRELE